MGKLGKRPALPEEAMTLAPEWWRDMMTDCWRQEPSDRPSFETVHEKLQQELERFRINERRRSTSGNSSLSESQASRRSFFQGIMSVLASRHSAQSEAEVAVPHVALNPAKESETQTHQVSDDPSDMACHSAQSMTVINV